MKNILLVISAALAAASASSARAHDFFLLPESFHQPGSGPVKVRATVGSSFPTPEIVVTLDRAESFSVVGAGQPQITGAVSTDTSLILEISKAEPGLLIASVNSKPREVDYAEDRIPLILGEYRVAPEAAAAVDRLARPRNWQVLSRRFAKTMLCVDSCSGGADAKQPIDGTLEFVAHGTGGDHFQLLSGGRPLGNYPVDLVGSEGKRQHLSTDADGLVHLPASAKGPMMLFAAFLTPPSGAERFLLDLSSLTFSR